MFTTVTYPIAVYGARALLLTGAGRGFCSGADLVDTAPSVTGAQLGENERRSPQFIGT